jgi:hypothetical protein
MERVTVTGALEYDLMAVKAGKLEEVSGNTGKAGEIREIRAMGGAHGELLQIADARALRN